MGYGSHIILGTFHANGLLANLGLDNMANIDITIYFFISFLTISIFSLIGSQQGVFWFGLKPEYNTIPFNYYLSSHPFNHFYQSKLEICFIVKTSLHYLSPCKV